MTYPSHPYSPPAFGLETERFEPGGVLVTVVGELDVATVPALRGPLDAALDSGVRRVVIDLHELAFLDSIAVAALLQVRRRLGPGGRLAVVVAPDSYTRMVFEIAGLPRSLDIVATRAEAIAAVGGGERGAAAA